MSPLKNASTKAKQFNDAYFTGESDVLYCLDALSKEYDLKGKTALEPAAGSGQFVRSSKGFKLKWTTNELFPENGYGFEADHNLDYLKTSVDELGRFDFVITNPPFGHASGLARSFILKSFEFTDVVAMVVPRGLRKETWYDKKVPRDIKITIDLDLPDSNFLLRMGRKGRFSVPLWSLKRSKDTTEGNCWPMVRTGSSVKLVPMIGQIGQHMECVAGVTPQASSSRGGREKGCLLKPCSSIGPRSSGGKSQIKKSST